MKCRHCDAELSLQLIDLGAAPPSNAYLATQEDEERHYPLRVLVCTECWLVQTDISLFTLNYDELFTKDYPYFSSTSAGWVEHARQFVNEVTNRFGLGPDSLTVEIGSNDGYLLQHVKTPCYGIEPTKTGELAKAKGVTNCANFFSAAVAKNCVEAFRGPADLVIANNVLAHVRDINDFAKGVSILLKDVGVATFEFPHLVNLIKGKQFDTIYHEHYSYLSLTAVKNVFASNGLSIFDVQRLNTHGGSLRVYAQRADSKVYTTNPEVEHELRKEEVCGVTRAAFYAGFQAVADRVKNDFVRFLMQAQELGWEVAGFGAAAKGNTLLNYAGVRADLLPYVVDETPAKQGKYLPGSRIPVCSEFKSRPDCVVILPWNHRTEIMAKLEDMRLSGTRFVTAVPRLEIV